MALEKCPECGNPLNGESVCPECGYQLVEVRDIFPCNNCGQMLSRDTEFCPHCGGKVTEQAAGILTIVVEGSGSRKGVTAPLYVNGQLVENIPLSEGSEVKILLNNPDIKVGFASSAIFVEHSYHLDTQQNYVLAVSRGINLGFTLYDESGYKLSVDKLNIWWFLFSLLIGGLAVMISFINSYSKPALSNSMKFYALVWFSIPFCGLPLLLFSIYNKPNNV